MYISCNLDSLELKRINQQIVACMNLCTLYLTRVRIFTTECTQCSVYTVPRLYTVYTVANQPTQSYDYVRV